MNEIIKVFFIRILLAGVIFATDIILARALGPDGKGLYYFFYIFPIMVSTLACFGLDYALNYCGHLKKSRVPALFSTSLLIGLGIATLFAVILIADFFGILSFFYQEVPDGHERSKYLSLFIMHAEVLFSLTVMAIITSGFPVIYANMRLARRSLLFLATLLVFLYPGLLIEDKIFFLVATQIVSVVVAVAVCLKACRIRLSWPTTSLFKPLLSEGTKVYFGRISERLQSRVDVIILGILGTTRYLGIYSVSVGIAEMLFFISSSVSAVLFSRKVDSRSDFHLKSFRIMIPIGFVLSVGTGIFGTFCVLFFYGEAFTGSIKALVFLLPGTYFLSLVHTLIPYAIQTGLSRAVSTAQFTGLALNIALNIMLIPLLGVVGASLSSSISYLITFLILLSWICRSNRSSFLDFAFPDGVIKGFNMMQHLSRFKEAINFHRRK